MTLQDITAQRASDAYNHLKRGEKPPKYFPPIAALASAYGAGAREMDSALLKALAGSFARFAFRRKLERSFFGILRLLKFRWNLLFLWSC